MMCQENWVHIRILSKTGLYHIYFRGINKQNLFEENGDYQKFLEIVYDSKCEKNFKIYAYCLMTNHVHLFIHENETGDIKKIMHQILTRYVGWYNFKYTRDGALISNRYKSEPIESETYYLNLLRYIHQNPIKAGIINAIGNYPWSSYDDYINNHGITDIEEFLCMFSEDRVSAVEMFKEFHEEMETENFDVSENHKLTPSQLKRKMKNILEIAPEKIIELPKSERNLALIKLRKNGFTIGQLQRLTGISRGIITNAK